MLETQLEIKDISELVRENDRNKKTQNKKKKKTRKANFLGSLSSAFSDLKPKTYLKNVTLKLEAPALSLYAFVPVTQTVRCKNNNKRTRDEENYR